MLEFGTNGRRPAGAGAEYKTVPAEQAGKPTIYAQGGARASHAATVAGPGEQTLLDQETEAGFSGELIVSSRRNGRGACGEVRKRAGVRGGRITRTIYVLPAGGPPAAAQG